MSVKVEVKMDAQIMSDFMVHHIFSGKAGTAAIALAALNIGFAVSFIVKGKYPMAVLFAVFAFVILCVFPWMIRRKVAKQMENAVRLKAPVTYEFDEEGIETVTQDDSGKAPWEKFQKALTHKNMIILYDAQRRSIILPLEQMGDSGQEVIEMIVTHMPAKAVKIRGSLAKKS